MEPLRISVLVSGNGSNFQAVIDAIEDGTIENARIVGVISSSENAFALQRAQQHEIPFTAITKHEYNDIRDRMDAILNVLESEHPDLIVLAGYLSILPPKVVEKFKGKIINIHPALLPKFGGKDHYGIKVHERVLAAGETESGATVHYVDEGVDTGEIILQEKVPVLPGDTPQILRERVLEVEHRILPQAIAMIEKARH